MPHRFLILAALVTVPAVAHADVRYEMLMQDTRRGDSVTQEMLVKDGMIRISTQDGGQDAMGSMIYRPADQELLIIDDDDKAVRRMTKADMDRMQGQMAAGMARMQDAMKNMPPEARARAEQAMQKMLGGSPGGTPAVETTVKAMGASDTVAGIDCDMYQVLENGVKTQELCAADLDDLKGGDEMVASMKGLASMMEGFTKTLGARAPKMDLGPVDGRFPVLSRQFDEGKLTYESRLVSIEETALSADQFKAPKGYRVRKLME
jgi:hypothetical protein